MRQTNQTKVSEQRWKTAQNWEKEGWINVQRVRAKWGKNIIWKLLAAAKLRSKYRGDDWNHWWSEKFDNYSFLPKEVENAVELGCGPYSNMRLIIPHCSPEHLVLSDPLIKTYSQFKLTFVSEAYRDGLCMLDDHAIEQAPFRDDYFDLVVMNNVIDHVMDADKCMQEAIRILKPGGWFIFGQNLTNDDDLKDKPTEDIGHPIVIEHSWVENHLKGRFDSHIDRILPREEGRAPKDHYGTYLFAGKKIS